MALLPVLGEGGGGGGSRGRRTLANGSRGRGPGGGDRRLELLPQELRPPSGVLRRPRRLRGAGPLLRDRSLELEGPGLGLRERAAEGRGEFSLFFFLFLAGCRRRGRLRRRRLRSFPFSSSCCRAPPLVPPGELRGKLPDATGQDLSLPLRCPPRPPLLARPRRGVGGADLERGKGVVLGAEQPEDCRVPGQPPGALPREEEGGGRRRRSGISGSDVVGGARGGPSLGNRRRRRRREHPALRRAGRGAGLLEGGGELSDAGPQLRVGPLLLGQDGLEGRGTRDGGGRRAVEAGGRVGRRRRGRGRRRRRRRRELSVAAEERLLLLSSLPLRPQDLPRVPRAPVLRGEELINGAEGADAAAAAGCVPPGRCGGGGSCRRRGSRGAKGRHRREGKVLLLVSFESPSFWLLLLLSVAVDAPPAGEPGLVDLDGALDGAKGRIRTRRGSDCGSSGLVAGRGGRGRRAPLPVLSSLLVLGQRGRGRVPSRSVPSRGIAVCLSNRWDRSPLRGRGGGHRREAGEELGRRAREGEGAGARRGGDPSPGPLRRRRRCRSQEFGLVQEPRRGHLEVEVESPHAQRVPDPFPRGLEPHGPRREPLSVDGDLDLDRNAPSRGKGEFLGGGRQDSEPVPSRACGLELKVEAGVEAGGDGEFGRSGLRAIFVVVVERGDEKGR